MKMMVTNGNHNREPFANTGKEAASNQQRLENNTVFFIIHIVRVANNL